MRLNTGRWSAALGVRGHRRLGLNTGTSGFHSDTAYILRAKFHLPHALLQVPH